MKCLIRFGIIAILIAVMQISNLKAQQNDNIKYGVELDALPYLSGGYYGSGWVGYNNFRFRLVAAKVKTPSFVVTDGFENLDTKAYAFIVDYFPCEKRDNLTGLWLGAGIEYWDNSITNSFNHQSAGFNSYQFTLGGGYVFNVWENLYLNPWIAGHLEIAGDRSVFAGTREYKPHIVLPEASIKLGWQF
ncbi:MAG: hypothetical protein P4L45_00395 [Ignavibacteriaceae bacterium]|nr:hypothetical protein [Ignavibacteriaceae bacterium]